MPDEVPIIGGPPRPGGLVSLTMPLGHQSEGTYGCSRLPQLPSGTQWLTLGFQVDNRVAMQFKQTRVIEVARSSEKNSQWILKKGPKEGSSPIGDILTRGGKPVGRCTVQKLIIFCRLVPWSGNIPQLGGGMGPTTSGLICINDKSSATPLSLIMYRHRMGAQMLSRSIGTAGHTFSSFHHR